MSEGGTCAGRFKFGHERGRSLIERKDGHSQGKFTAFVGRGVDGHGGGVWGGREGAV